MSDDSNAVQAIGSVAEYAIQVKEHHLDMFGHVNNAVYLEIFEEARWELCTERGYSLKDVMTNMQGPTILDVNLQFRREIRNRETIVIKTFVTSQAGKITKLRQIMVNARGEEACIADFTVALFDMRARKLIEPTEAWRRVLGI